MLTISGSRRGLQRTAAVVAVAGLASASTMGTASAEAVPPWGKTPSITAMYKHDGGPTATQTWSPGSAGAPGVVSVANPSAPSSSAASSGNLGLGQLSTQTAAQDDGTPVNRMDARTTVDDGFYLAAPATVTLTYAISGSADANATGDGAATTDLDAVVAIDCPIVEGGCFPDDPNDALPTIGKRAGVTVVGDQFKPLSSSGSVDIPLTAGWHTVLAKTSSSSRAAGPGGSTGNVSMTFSLEVVDVLGEPKVGWSRASGLLPITGGTEIGNTPPPPPPPAPTPADKLSALAASITDAQKSGAIRNARPLLSKVEEAQRQLSAGNQTAAAGSMTALRNHLRAQSGKHIPADLATAWSSAAAAVFTKA